MRSSPNTIKKTCKTADEHDAFTSWRRYLLGLERPGVVKGIKRTYNKRMRREAKDELRERADH